MRFILIIIILFFNSLACAATPINIVAAENFYGDIAQQIGGSYVHVTNILNNPQQDPHLFSATPSTARMIADADIVVYNGIAYDVWMEKLLAANKNNSQTVIVVAQLLNKKIGDNPHIWYNPLTMPIYAKALTEILSQKDPAHRVYYIQQLTLFNNNYQKLLGHINQIKQAHQHTVIIATEPVFNDMAQALGLTMAGEDFQLSIMNDATPSATQIKNFESYLRNKTARVLIYNDQVNNPLTQRMQNLAISLIIPTVGVSELQPAGKTYIEWMQGQLDELEKALSR